MRSLYDTDLFAWSVEQAHALREARRQRVNVPVDWENVAEEIESLGKSERRTLGSRIGTVIEHLLKLEVSPATSPAGAWRDTIRHTRREITKILAESPSLRREVPDMVAQELQAARELVVANLADYGEQPRQAIDAITYDADAILGDWFPDPGRSHP